MILCRQISDVIANENARYKRNELEFYSVESRGMHTFYADILLETFPTKTGKIVSTRISGSNGNITSVLAFAISDYLNNSFRDIRLNKYKKRLLLRRIHHF